MPVHIVVTTMLKGCYRCEPLDPDIDPNCPVCDGTGNGLALIFYSMEWGTTIRTSSWLE